MASQTETFLIGPEVPFEAEYPLTLVDGLAPPSNSSFLWIYETTEEKEDAATYRKDLTDRLKQSLQTYIQNPSTGVKGYPELLGMVCEDSTTARVSVKVNKSSKIKFTVANRNDILYQDLRPDLQFPVDCVPLEDFATGLKTIVPTDKVSRPAFWVQLTFVNGGYVVMANKHHFISDGTAQARFTEDWFRKARELKGTQSSMEISPCQIDRSDQRQRLADFEKEATTNLAPRLNYKVVPGARRTMYGCPDFDSAVVLIAKRVVEFISYWFPSLPLGTKTQLFYFKKESLFKLKVIAEKSSGVRLSTNDALSAFMWRCITRVRQTGVVEKPVTASKFLFTADFRKRLDPPLPANYFGNAIQCIAASMPIPTLLEPLDDFLGVAAAEVRKGVNAINTNLVRSSIQFVASHERTSDVVQDLKIFRGNDIFTTSWEKFYTSMDALDLGVGKFRRARCPGRPSYDGGYIVMPAYGMRDQELEDAKSYPGGLEVLLDLRKPHMEALMVDPEWCQYVSWAGKVDGKEM